ncbi:MAG: hypothetical protein DRG83_03725 [Deltaproteobacteria bacterium]|nr:MAG: hypothetical protein DRG83_03725 [Deltaproteobacteria bacterium]
MNKLFFLTDDLHYRYGDYIAPKSGNDSLFIAGFYSYFQEIVVCAPIQELDAPLLTPPEWPKKIRFAGLAPYETVLEYAKRLPKMLWHNLPVLWREIRRADMVWIRLPAANGIFAFLIAKALRRPTVVFLVGDVDKVSAANPRYRGWLAWLRKVGVYVDWKVTVFMARRSLVFAYGSELANKLRQAGCSDVEVSFTSLVKDEDLRYPDKTSAFAPQTFRILFIGRLSKEKGVHILFEAASLLGKDGYRLQLDIVGSGPDERNLKSWLKALPADVLVKFWGYLPHGEKFNHLIKQAEVFVLPSLSEGVPKVLLEVMAKGVPVVASEVGGIPDLITHNHNGLLVPPRNPQALAEAIKVLLDDNQLRSRIACGAFHFAQEHTHQKQVARIMGQVHEYLSQQNLWQQGIRDA